MNRIKEFYKKVDGTEILRQYAQSHILFRTLLLVPQVGHDKKALEIIRLITDYKLKRRLKHKYKRFIEIWKKENCFENREETFNSANTIWFCWLQGLEKAPEIVKKCYRTIVEYNAGRDIIVVTLDNYMNYVKFPEFIEKKMQDKTISMTHFSDLLRLELLIHYGGTWIDSTVFLTGAPYDYMMNSKLFLFQELKPGVDGHTTTISNWFITAQKDNIILRLTRDLLYEYWKKNQRIENYYIFHQLFQLAIEAYPEEWKNVIPFSNETPHILLLRLFEQYDENTWLAIREQTPIHKLTYKFEERLLDLDGTYYRQLFDIPKA